MKQLLFLFAAVTLSFNLMAQDSSKVLKNRKEEKRKRINALARQEEEGIIVYKKHFAFGIKLLTDGYSIMFEKGKTQSVKKALLFQLEIGERKDQKEIKITNPNAPSAPIIYGKLNFFYPVKLGVQHQFLLGNKSNKNGVSITGNVGGGLCVGLLRPYEVQVDKSGVPTWVKYNSPDSLLFINGPYYGGPSLSQGWDGLKVTPGIYLKPAVRFDYGKFNEMISAIEVGLTAEYYTSKIPQMLYNKQEQLFFSAYFSLMFGKRK